MTGGSTHRPVIGEPLAHTPKRKKRNRRAPGTDRVAGLVTSVHTSHSIHPYASIHTSVNALSHLNRGLLRGRQRKPRSSNNYTPLSWTEAFGDDAQRKNVFRSARCTFVLYTRHWCVRLARYDGRMRFESIAHRYTHVLFIHAPVSYTHLTLPTSDLV